MVGTLLKKLTYPLPNLLYGAFDDDVPFANVGYVVFLEGSHPNPTILSASVPKRLLMIGIPVPKVGYGCFQK